MSDVREVSEWHEAMEGSMTVAAERLADALHDLSVQIQAAVAAEFAAIVARFSDGDSQEPPRPPSPSPQVRPEKKKAR